MNTTHALPIAAEHAAAAVRLADRSHQLRCQADRLAGARHPDTTMVARLYVDAKNLAKQAKARVRGALMHLIHEGSCHISTLHQLGRALRTVGVGVEIVAHTPTHLEIVGQYRSYTVRVEGSRAVILRDDEPVDAQVPVDTPTPADERTLDVAFDVEEVLERVDTPAPVRIASAEEVGEALAKVYARRRGAPLRSCMAELPLAARCSLEEVEEAELVYDMGPVWAQVAA